jgi:UDP-N-acetylmuramoyl-L-alanyl-D-glutamate--2,6-diaminopimelate ligase
MLLHDLLRQFDPALSLSGIPDSVVAHVREDSRLVGAGDLFVARASTLADGSKYAADAAAKGAVAIVTETKIPGLRAPQVLVSSASTAVSSLAHLFYGDPTEKVKTIGVTGTNGKTTTTYLIRHLLGHVKQRCGMIGTVEIDDGRICQEAAMTTPGPCELAELLGRMRDKGTWRCAMEVSSHALDQGRVEGVHFVGAGFTNLTGDHLDYHKTMEKYAAAKARLFDMLDEGTVAAVNAGSEWSAQMVRGCKGRIIRFGFGRDADYQARDLAVTAAGSSFILVTPDGRAEVRMGLIGRHNIENALLAAALVGEVFGLSVHQIAAGLKDAAGAPGRLQAVRCGQPFAVLVDYAHTDDALDNVLAALRPLTKGKLRVVFGCGGDRDNTKRPRMARVAEKYADAIYITSDNPRTEEPESILNMIEAGFSRKHGKPVLREVDRRTAIERALGDAATGDVVLLAGKGHESYQIVGTERRHFDDAEEAQRVLRESVVGAKR